MRAEAHVKITLTVTLTLTLKFQQYEYQHVGLVEFYPVICSSWRSDTAVKTYIAVPCFPSVPFCKIITTCLTIIDLALIIIDNGYVIFSLKFHVSTVLLGCLCPLYSTCFDCSMPTCVQFLGSVEGELV